MKRIKLPFIVLAMVVLTMVIVQSCDIFQSDQQKSGRQKERAILEKAFRTASKKYAVAKATALKTAPQTLQRVKSMYSGGSQNILKFPSSARGTNHYKSTKYYKARAPFTKQMLGELDYKHARIQTLRNGETFVQIPVIGGKPKDHNKNEYRIATLIAPQNDMSNTILIVAKPNKDYIKKEKGSSNIQFAMRYTGGIEVFQLRGRKIISGRKRVFQDGMLIKTKKFVIGNTLKSENIAGAARPRSCCGSIGTWFSNWGESTWHTATHGWNSVTNWWNSGGEDCLTDPGVVGTALLAVAGTAACAGTIAGDFATWGLTTDTVFVACTGMAGAGAAFYDQLVDTPGCQVGSP